MSGTRREPIFAQYSMEVECPECGKKIIVQIGLTGHPKNDWLECPGCHTGFVPLVPGPIVNGPSPKTE
jgi:rubredoxin